MHTRNNSILIFLALFIFACNHPTPQSSTKKVKTADTTSPQIRINTEKSFNVNGQKVVPKAVLGFNSINKTGADTLDIVICADFVYSPFGTIKDTSAFGSSLLKSFAVVTKLDKMDADTPKYQTLTHGTSKLIFFFDNDPEASRHSFIFKGEIYDTDVEFINGIKVGMGISDFYKTLFTSFPNELKDRYHVILLTSCVEDIEHTYTFTDGKLNSVKFKTDSNWKVDY